MFPAWPSGPRVVNVPPLLLALTVTFSFFFFLCRATEYFVAWDPLAPRTLPFRIIELAKHRKGAYYPDCTSEALGILPIFLYFGGLSCASVVFVVAVR